MRIVFIGSSGFGFRSLEKIIDISRCKVVGIITNRQTFRISYSPHGFKNILYADLSPLAKKNRIPIFLMKDKMSDPRIVGAIKRCLPDLIVVIGWYHHIPKIIRDIAPVVGLHASLLPDYSGGAPLVWAMINGEKKTGITFFMFDKGVDGGPIIGQKQECIRIDDTIGTLYSRIERKGIKLLQEYLPRIADGNVKLRQQDESKRRIMPQRIPEDGEINWNNDVLTIYNFIRAQTKPYPGAFTYRKGKKLIIWESRLCSLGGTFGSPGQVLKVVKNKNDGGFIISAKNNKEGLLITKVGTPSIDFMHATDYVKVYNLKEGEILR